MFFVSIHRHAEHMARLARRNGPFFDEVGTVEEICTRICRELDDAQIGNVGADGMVSR